jgi:putative ABC transport system permease protein
VGDALTLDTPSGPQSFEIVGTVLGAIEPVKPGSLSLILDREVYRRLWHDDRIDRLLIKLKPGSDAQAERRAMQKDFAESGVVVISPADLSAALDGTLRNIVIVAQILSLLLLVTLTLGIANTIVINVLDRRREMGTLRAIGLRGREVAIGVMLETALLVAVASALAVPMGIFTNHANTLTMQDVFAIRFTLNAGDVIRSLGLVLLSALLASYFPARQAGQVDVIEALRWE